jgi:hypothetical protein
MARGHRARQSTVTQAARRGAGAAHPGTECLRPGGLGPGRRMIPNMTAGPPLGGGGGGAPGLLTHWSDAVGRPNTAPTPTAGYFAGRIDAVAAGDYTCYVRLGAQDVGGSPFAITALRSEGASLPWTVALYPGISAAAADPAHFPFFQAPPRPLTRDATLDPGPAAGAAIWLRRAQRPPAAGIHGYRDR